MRKVARQREKVRPGLHSIFILFCLLALQPNGSALAQEREYQIVDFIDLPYELRINPDSSCIMEFQEQWIVNAAGLSISKKINGYEVPCESRIEEIMAAKESVRLSNISYEFSFLDPHNAPARDLQDDIIALIDIRYPVNKIYDMPAQLLSVYFHEEWVLDPDNQEIVKKVKGLTPVIWQKRQTADAEPIHDPDTGYPVYFKQNLKRIDLRNP